jgi:general secretion pathway protein H
MSATGSRPAGGRAGGRPDAGATLIEMMVVLGILGLITAMTFPAWMSPLRRVQLYEARAALVGHLRTARADAVRGGGPVTLELAQDGGAYGWERSRAMLPVGVRIEGDPRAITFFSDGTSSGGALKITGRGRGLTVEVDPASGLTEAPPG